MSGGGTGKWVNADEEVADDGVSTRVEGNPELWYGKRGGAELRGLHGAV